MNKTKKVFISTFAFALAAPMFATSVFAADVTGSNDGTGSNSPKTNVVYDNSTTIPDPENPDNPEWAVKVPSSIQFKDGAGKVNADVTLISKNGGILPNQDIKISVKSDNGYLLKMTGATDDMKYAMEYKDSTAVTAGTSVILNDTMTTPQADKPIGKLNGATEAQQIIKGDAILKGTATKSGEHIDLLTYTVTVTNP